MHRRVHYKQGYYTMTASSKEAVRSEFARRLRETVTGLGITYTDVARDLKVSPQSVQQWASGEAMPRPDRLPGLAEALHVTPEYLISASTTVAQATVAESELHKAVQDYSNHERDFQRALRERAASRRRALNELTEYVYTETDKHALRVVEGDGLYDVLLEDAAGLHYSVDCALGSLMGAGDCLVELPRDVAVHLHNHDGVAGSYLVAALPCVLDHVRTGAHSPLVLVLPVSLFDSVRFPEGRIARRLIFRYNDGRWLMMVVGQDVHDDPTDVTRYAGAFDLIGGETTT